MGGDDYRNAERGFKYNESIAGDDHQEKKKINFMDNLTERDNPRT